MDNATRSSEHIHQLNILPEWEFTRSRTKDGATFAFHSSQMCPGYSIQVSNWRLRKNARDQCAPSEDIGDLILGAHNELKRVLGESAFEKTNRVQSVMRKNAELHRAALDLRKNAGQSRERLFQADRWDILSRKIMKICLVRAAIEDLILAPGVEILSFPLVTLTALNKSRYIVENAPWSFNKPPRRVEHLAMTGFNSGLMNGILAFAPGSEDVWIVSKFSQCEVELKWDRGAAVLAEFPYLKDMSRSLAEQEKKVVKAEIAPPSPPENLKITEALMWGILEKIAVHDAKLTTHPTPSEFFRAYMIEKLTTKAMRRRKWKDRTIRNRRQLVETVIAEQRSDPKVNLRKFRDDIDPRIFHTAERQIEAVRKRGREAFLDRNE
ncbi:MAG: hypothetical protein NTV49_06000 [Kiritimatiellaeota bacterium]|nr:hypothetical protein [Kiritimatiellota bacterium]